MHGRRCRQVCHGRYPVRMSGTHGRDHDRPLHLDAPEVPVGLGAIADVFIDPAKEPERRMHVMTLADYGLILASVLIAACGQLLLRHAMLTIRDNHPDTHGVELLWQAARSLEVIAGLSVFGVSALLWLVTLSKVPLSKAYPFTAIGFIAILAASSVLFDEHVGPQLWIGALIVVAGLLIVVRAGPAKNDEPASKGAGAAPASTAPHVPRT